MQVKSWSQLIEVILLRRISFLLAFFVIFTLSYATLSFLDWLPEPVEPRTEMAFSDTNNSNPASAETSSEAEGVSVSVIDRTTPVEDLNGPVNASVTQATVSDVYPVSMYIESLDRRIDILNPTSRGIADLDAALLKGAVRHPDSATLDRDGTVFILGHSSYLPVVNNKAFQAFNDIQKLKWGDLIEITASEGKYIYRIDKVYRAKAQNVTVPIAGNEKRLYLATCNSFGSTDDRYIVEAVLVETKLF